MAKMNKYEAQHLQNVAKYEAEIKKLFNRFATECAFIAGIDPMKATDKPFSFDATPASKKRIEELMKKLSSSINTIITNGIDAERQLASRHADALIRAVFPSLKPRYIAKLINDRKQRAQRAFNERAGAGIDLSKDVWRLTEQFRGEMEMALDLGIGEGKSADELSRDVRKYLNNPKNLFRKVRDKHGVLHLSQRAKQCHYGRGVYRSAYKNARRLTATETNIAYRSADHDHRQALECVVGIRVVLSNNHTCLDSQGVPQPFEDICDQLAQAYPKEFKFVGWHPHCRCHTEAILKTREEINEDIRRILRGEKPLPASASKNYVSKLPSQFNDWMENNAERIKRAKSLPYFIRDNQELIANGGVVVAELTPAQRAEQRHAQRTKEEIAHIKDRWEAHKKWKNGVLNDAYTQYFESDSIIDVDTTTLSKYLNGYNLTKIIEETQKVKIKTQIIKQKYQAMSDIIPNPTNYVSTYSLDEMRSVYDAVTAKLNSWSSLPLAEQEKKLKFEAYDFLGGNMKGVQQKYKTWEVSQSAYLKRLQFVVMEQKKIELNAKIVSFKSWAIDNKKYTSVAKLVEQASDIMKNAGEYADLLPAISIVGQIQTKINKAEAKKVAKGYKVVESEFKPQDYTKARKDGAVWAMGTKEADMYLRPKCGRVWIGATDDEKDAIHGYTGSYNHINKPLRGIPYVESASHARLGEKRIPLIERIISKSRIEHDMWLQRGGGMVELKKFGLSNFANATDKEIMALVGSEGVDGAFVSAGVAKGKGFSGAVITNIYAPKGTQAMYCEPFSLYGHGQGRKWDGVTQQSSFGYESEILIQRGTKFKITKVEKGAGGTWYIDVDIIEQKPLPFPYVGGYPFK